MQEILLNELTKEEQSLTITKDAKYLGIFIGKDLEALNLKIKFEHSQANVKSLIMYKAILLDSSQFNMYGLLKVLKNAKLVNTYLKISVLILSKQAKANVEPALEIMETDVKAGHGATVTRIDPQHLFYLASRGISQTNARSLISKAFLTDLFSQFKAGSSRTYIKEKLKTLDQYFTDKVKLQ